MELVKGQTLKGPIPLDTALKYAAQIASALDAAHEKGITRRDLKPANIMVTPDGTIKVLDSGLAAVTQHSRDDGQIGTDMATLTMSPTQAGMIMGTAGSMSPEQASGQTVDRRSDIWAFGVVLWELLTGKQLFEGTTVSHILAAVLTKEPDYTQVPYKVRRLLRRCLEKDPQKRLSHIGAAMELLDVDAEAAPVAVATPVQSRLIKLAWAVVGVLALALGFVSYRLVSEELPLVVKVSVLPPEKATIVANSLPAVSPDGRHLAFAAAVDGKTELWVRDLDSLAARALTGTDNANGPFWSPDSHSIAFFAAGKLKRIDVAGGPELTLCDAGPGRGGSWSKNDVILFALPTSGIFRVSAAGGTATPVTELDKTSGEISHRFPWFLPDGRHFLYTMTGAAVTGKKGVYVGDIDSKVDSKNGAKNRQPILADDSMAAYAPSGYLLFVRERTLMAQRFDPGKMQATGDAVPVAEQIDSGGANPAQYQFSVSQGGVLVYSSGGTTGAYQLAWTDRSGKVVSPAGPVGTYGDFRLSPDEKKIAFDKTEANNQDIWVMDLARGVTSRLTFDPGQDNMPMWSFDGLHILYANRRSGTFDLYDLYSKAPTGAGQEELLVKMGTINGWGTSWSRDGRFLMYVNRAADSKTGYDLWVAPQFGDGKPFPYLQTQFDEMDGAFSPDGRWVAYQSNESGRNEIYVQAFPLSGAKFQVSTGGGLEPAWRNDGSELFFRSADGNLMAVPVKSGAAFEVGVPKSLFPLAVAGGGSGRRSYAASSDGQRFLVAANSGSEKSIPFTVVLNWPAGLKK